MIAQPQTITTWEDFITEAQYHNRAIIAGKFGLGDVALRACGMPARGRPALGSEDVMLPKFAFAVGIKIRTLSDYRQVAEFYLYQMRDLCESWTLFRTAMREALRQHPENRRAARIFAKTFIERELDSNRPEEELEKELTRGRGSEPAEQFTFRQLCGEWGITSDALLDMAGSMKRRADGRIVLTLEVG